MVDPTAFTMQWDQLGGAIAAVGSLGVAAFGLVESAGKAFAFTFPQGRERHLAHWGLPYVGLGVVRKMAMPLRPALRCAYGDDFAEIIAQQYRANRSDGSAPDTIRQGVRLGLPFLSVTAAEDLIASVWHMDPSHSKALAVALQAEPPAPATSTGAVKPASTPNPGIVDPTQALAGRFATALDARINAAFQLADERYETVAKTMAGGVAVILSGLLNYGLATSASPDHGLYSWPIAVIIGLVAVPIAPVAKDVSTSLQNALTAFKSISGKSISGKSS